MAEYEGKGKGAHVFRDDNEGVTVCIFPLYTRLSHSPKCPQ